MEGFSDSSVLLPDFISNDPISSLSSESQSAGSYNLLTSLGTDMNVSPVVSGGIDTNQLVISNEPVDSASTVDVNAVILPTESGQVITDANTLRSWIVSGAVQLTDAQGRPIEIAGVGHGGSQTLTLISPTSTHDSTTETTVTDADAEMNDLLQSAAVAQITLPPLPSNIPANTPVWAARLRDFEKVGDYYRGWVENDIELDLLLTYHKQQTQSTWGTRQSPSGTKQTTRLMWRSQYCPFDGIPFLNAGSRAIVMECQYGPRRKGMPFKKDSLTSSSGFRPTCPARIYVKRVKKFVNYAIDVTSQDKKAIKLQMDNAFEDLKRKNYRAVYQERYYVQLPTVNAHENHIEWPTTPNTHNKIASVSTAHAPAPPPKSEIKETKMAAGESRLHPLVQDKIRLLVAGGETRLYAIRKQLRKFVEKELFESADNVPDRHNLTYFPTVHDLQNHIHQAMEDIGTGVLPMAADDTVMVKLMGEDSNSLVASDSLWTVSDVMAPHATTVIITFRPNPLFDVDAIENVCRVETVISDGSTRITNTLTPAALGHLTKLFPTLFPLDNILRSIVTCEDKATQVKLQIAAGTTESRQLAVEALVTDQFITSLVAPPPTSTATDSVAPDTPLDSCASSGGGGHSIDALDLSSDDLLVSSSSQVGDVSPTAPEVVAIKQEPSSNSAEPQIGDVSLASLNAAPLTGGATLIASSTDESDYALVQTETGQFLIAKGNMEDGYHVLGQAESPFTNFGAQIQLQGTSALNLVQPATVGVSDAQPLALTIQPQLVIAQPAPTTGGSGVFSQLNTQTLSAVDDEVSATDYTTAANDEPVDRLLEVSSACSDAVDVALDAHL